MKDVRLAKYLDSLHATYDRAELDGRAKQLKLRLQPSVCGEKERPGMGSDPLHELATAASERGAQPLPYQTPPAGPGPAPARAPAKGLFRTGFFFGLGFFTAGLVFWAVMFVGSLVLGGVLASACSAAGPGAPAPAPWNFGR